MSTTFPLFQSLPVEIRHYIWHLSLSNDQVIRISCNRGIRPSGRRYARCFRANRANPPQLQVNVEARQEALRRYTPYFRTEYAPYSCIYLAPEWDVVHLHEAVLAYLGTTERAALRHVIIDVQDYMAFGSYWMDSLRSMEHLQEVVLVVLPLTFSPHWVSNHRDDDIVGMLKGAFVECAQTNPEWVMPQVQVKSHAGTVMGGIIVEADDLEIT
ncbi:hypothetical protein BDV28DRAFT_106863 [Aspergillus coremiiformis]|uniref:2EXR domain-containing protein n=1 Tax=Aspergillus coremiiformis TaxID=138285 RepID=A0A5N6Z9P8_9EURO|nr:hypothetical protein BDV28DRAFT_106863 [Aspergillus coremiiformis]